MKILNISQSFEITGGSDVYFHALTTLLKENGIDVDEFAASVDGSKLYPKAIDYKKTSVADVFKHIYNFDAKRKISSYIKDKTFNLAHLHIYYGMLSGSILKPLKEKSIPIIQTLHEYKLVCPTYKLYDGDNICFTCQNNKFYKSLSKKCNRGSLARTMLSAVESYASLWAGSQDTVDHFITVSDFQKNQIVKMGFDASKMTTVHNFINISPSAKNKKAGDYVLYFGRIEKEKGIQILLDAFKELPSSVKLLIVGDGGYRDEMLHQINTSKALQSNIVYLAFKQRAEINDIILNSKFVVVPSIWYETFGLTVVEAMAFGKAVIGSNLGGITEIITDGVDGFLIAPNDSNILKEKILELWKDNTLLEQMGDNAFNKVQQKFSQKSHFDQINNIYRKFGVK